MILIFKAKSERLSGPTKGSMIIDIDGSKSLAVSASFVPDAHNDNKIVN